ncbi:hypothetical protein [Nocardia bovistercoris]|uniref:Uncharacterized protein n=1 Tax=Nocardia bovistercoris TaxID=2785916 RepID=A0A931IFJ7_9NOCA|nr:hypothetical protein [Nocardia bovistercoris]MBH0778773.1 hypothetical protein [Nocardia bovistercoris]
MRNNHSTLEKALTALETAANVDPTWRAVPHWDLNRSSSGYRVTVWVPAEYAGLPEVTSVDNDGFPGVTAWLQAERPDALAAINAMLDELADAAAAVTAKSVAA